MRVMTAQLKRQSAEVPPDDVLRRQVLERLILERLQLQQAERSGIRVDDAMLNEALRRIAGQNKLSLEEFRKVLERDGYDFAAFREGIRNEIIIGELRRRQIENRIVVTDREVDNVLVTAAQQAHSSEEYRLDQVLVPLPESPGERAVEAARTRAEAVLADIRKGSSFGEAAATHSEGGEALTGGELGWRSLSQLPGPVADAVLRLKPGQVSDVVRSAEGFHVVRVLEVRHGQRLMVTQTRARHILLKPGPSLSDEAAVARLTQLRQRVEGGDDFAELARAHSADPGSAARGGDLGWLSPGDVVPEFERTMGELGIGQMSEPFRTQYGWHLVQVLERRQQDSTEDMRRSRAREFVRQRKVEEETQAWLRRLRDEAYVDIRPEE
jgi:peptidyl-prolyl cis-trans isomerase SurA